MYVRKGAQYAKKKKKKVKIFRPWLLTVIEPHHVLSRGFRL